MSCAELWEWGAFKASGTWSRTQNFPPGRGRYGYETRRHPYGPARQADINFFFGFFFLLLILKARHRLCRKRENPRSLVKGWGGEITIAWSRWPWKHVKEQRVSGVTEMKIFIVAPISPLDRRKVFFDLPCEKISGESTPWVIPQSLYMRWKVSISNSNTMKAVAAIVNTFSTKKWWSRILGIRGSYSPSPVGGGTETGGTRWPREKEEEG